jgi:hypothetical protein
VTPEASGCAPLTSEMPRPASGRPVGRSGNPIKGRSHATYWRGEVQIGPARVLQLDPEARHRRAGRCGASVFLQGSRAGARSFRYRLEVSQLR